MQGHTRDPDDTDPVPGGPDVRPTIRERVDAELGDEPFVAAIYRQTTGTPSYPDSSEERFERLADLPAEPFDAGAVFAELVVFSETHVYRWAESGTAIDVTRLPRTPDAMDDER